MSALLHQTLDAMAGEFINRAYMNRPFTIAEMRDLGRILKDASDQARAIEGANVVPWPRDAARAAYVRALNAPGPEAA